MTAASRLTVSRRMGTLNRPRDRPQTQQQTSRRPRRTRTVPISPTRRPPPAMPARMPGSRRAMADPLPGSDRSRQAAPARADGTGLNPRQPYFIKLDLTRLKAAGLASRGPKALVPPGRVPVTHPQRHTWHMAGLWPWVAVLALVLRQVPAALPIPRPAVPPSQPQQPPFSCSMLPTRQASRAQVEQQNLPAHPIH